MAGCCGGPNALGVRTGGLPRVRRGRVYAVNFDGVAVAMTPSAGKTALDPQLEVSTGLQLAAKRRQAHGCSWAARGICGTFVRRGMRAPRHAWADRRERATTEPASMSTQRLRESTPASGLRFRSRARQTRAGITKAECDAARCYAGCSTTAVHSPDSAHSDLDPSKKYGNVAGPFSTSSMPPAFRC